MIYVALILWYHDCHGRKKKTEGFKLAIKYSDLPNPMGQKLSLGLAQLQGAKYNPPMGQKE